MKVKQCPFSIYVYPCERKSCWADETAPNCSIRQEYEGKLNEKIGENVRQYWNERACRPDGLRL